MRLPLVSFRSLQQYTPISALFLGLFSSSLGLALPRTCPTLDQPLRDHIVGFLAGWFHLPTEHPLTLVDQRIDDECYRSMTFRSASPAPLIKVYLTPDGKRLVTGMMDLSVSPRQLQRDMQHDLDTRLTQSALARLVTGATSLVVFSDYQCPYCRNLFRILSQLTQDERAHLSITFHQLPLPMHQWARKASELSTCVALHDVGAFWHVSAYLFEHQQDITDENVQSRLLSVLSEDDTYDTSSIKRCIDTKAFEKPLDEDMHLASDYGISSTPTVFVNGRRINVRNIDDLRRALMEAASD